MAEFTSEIALEPANQAINNSGDFYKPTRYAWFGSPGTQRYTHPNTFRPDFGHGANWDQNWVQNVSTGSIPDFYVTRQKAPWKIPTSISNADHGFYIEKPSTTEAKQINIRIDGGIGHWMPATIYRNIGWYWKNATALNSNWRVWSPGLVLRNWKTNEEKIYSIGWTEAAYVSTAGQIKVVTGQQKSDPVNALGPDWFIYGAIFQMRSDGTSGNQNPKAELLDLVLSWHSLDTGPGATKLIIPDKMSWDDFRALKQRGEVAFYSLNKPCREVNKVSNGNSCPYGNGTKMRARKSSSGGVTYLQWEDPDYANYVSAGDTVYVNGNPYVVDSVSVSYCGQEQYQTTQLTIKENIPNVEVAGTNITISLCAP